MRAYRLNPRPLLVFTGHFLSGERLMRTNREKRYKLIILISSYACMLDLLLLVSHSLNLHKTNQLGKNRDFTNKIVILIFLPKKSIALWHPWQTCP
jgi:hypothetical protein